MKFYITGTRRGLGEALKLKLNTVSSLEECDVFINCKHNSFEQVELLYRAAELGKRIINIGSNSPDQSKSQPHIYQVEKAALDIANNQLYYQGVDTTIVRFGWFDSPRVAEVNDNKMSLQYCVDTIEWVLIQPHRVKEITVTPNLKQKDEQLAKAEAMHNLSTMYQSSFKRMNKQYDIKKIQEEVNTLLEQHNLKLGQIMLQSADGKDFYYGIGKVDNIVDADETKFNISNLPNDAEITKFMNEQKLYRTRIMVASPKTCYEFHYDPSPRVHLVVKTNEWAFLADDMKLVHLPADGYPYYLDTTKPHTAINSSLEDRIHIVGCVST